MAKRAKPKSPDGDGVSATRGNGFDPEVTEAFVTRIENLYDDMASEQGSYMAKCKELRADIKEVLDEAKAAGIPKKELKAVIEKRKLEAKIEAIRDELEGESQDTYDQLCAALGDFGETELGKAAASRVKPAEDRPAAH